MNSIVRDLRLDDPAQAVAVATLDHWGSMAEEAFSHNTRRARRADWTIFLEFCLRVGLPALPAATNTVRDFVFDRVGMRKKPASIRRYVATIGRAHRAGGVADPTVSEEVKLALKEMSQGLATRQRQARGLVWSEIAAFLEFEPRNLRDKRDRALVAVAYDTMCRRQELVSLLVEDLSPADDGSGTVLIRRSKTDVTGEVATAYLSPLSMRLVAEWLQSSHQIAGPIFARIMGTSRVGTPLTAQSVTTVLRKVGQWIGLDPKERDMISGHSVRVGAVQDLLALNMDLPSVMQAGRWKDTRMPMKYGERVVAGRGAMARAAKAQGRA